MNLNKVRAKASARINEMINIRTSMILMRRGDGRVCFDDGEGHFVRLSGSLRVCSLAEKLIACVPTIIISNKFITPRIIGMFSHFILWVIVLYGLFLTLIFPLGLRTAMLMLFGDLIITPSITACPPTAKSIFFSFALSSQFKIMKFVFFNLCC